MLDGLKGRLVTRLGFSQASEEPQRSRADRHTPDPATVAERQSIFLAGGGGDCSSFISFLSGGAHFSN